MTQTTDANGTGAETVAVARSGDGEEVVLLAEADQCRGGQRGSKPGRAPSTPRGTGGRIGGGASEKGGRMEGPLSILSEGPGKLSGVRERVMKARCGVTWGLWWDEERERGDWR